MANYIQNINIQVEDYLPEDFSLSSNWKDHMVRINEIHQAGNSIRASKGLTEKGLEHFFRSPDVNEFFLSVQRKVNAENSITAESAELEVADGIVTNRNELNLTIINSKRGKYGGTWAHPLVALRLAAWLDPDLEVEIYSRFLENKIIERRVESSDAWNKLRYSYSSMVGDSFKWFHFVHIADAIGKKLECDDWDTADEETLIKRTKIQDTLSFLMDSKVIKNREQVLRTINKMEV